MMPAAARERTERRDPCGVPGWMRATVVTFHLEMTDPSALHRVPLEGKNLDVQRAEIPSPELNRFFYTAVGGDWRWVDRLGWSFERWMRWLDRDEVETWIASVSGTPAGYFELEAQPGGSVEIAYFGLLPRFTGRRLGGALLTLAVERAWARGARRVWVHTCTLDHPGALQNYRARGFRVFKEETSEVEISDLPPGPWPGAHRERETGASDEG